MNAWKIREKERKNQRNMLTTQIIILSSKIYIEQMKRRFSNVAPSKKIMKEREKKIDWGIFHH